MQGRAHLCILTDQSWLTQLKLATMWSTQRKLAPDGTLMVITCDVTLHTCGWGCSGTPHHVHCCIWVLLVGSSECVGQQWRIIYGVAALLALSVHRSEHIALICKRLHGMLLHGECARLLAPVVTKRFIAQFQAKRRRLPLAMWCFEPLNLSSAVSHRNRLNAPGLSNAPGSC